MQNETLNQILGWTLPHQPLITCSDLNWCWFWKKVQNLWRYKHNHERNFMKLNYDSSVFVQGWYGIFPLIATVTQSEHLKVHCHHPPRQMCAKSVGRHFVGLRTCGAIFLSTLGRSLSSVNAVAVASLKLCTAISTGNCIVKWTLKDLKQIRQSKLCSLT